ncbi:MAG: ABC transporter permease, partial [Candidatus Methylomirabilales bacterium]
MPVGQLPVDAVILERSKLRDWGRAVLRFVRQKPLGTAGAVIVILMVLAAIFADVIAPRDPLETDYVRQFTPPNATAWLGTDAYGRDALSRIIYGSR